MDAIKEFLSEFDPAALLPELDTFLGKVELVARIAILIAPAMLLFLGLCYLLFPAREANHSYGYRFFWGMNSVEAWRFTQKVAGLVWGLLGLLMGGVMYLFSAKFHGMELMDAVMLAVKCILWELGIVAVSCIAIDITVFASYNSRGIARREPRPRKQKEVPVQEFYEPAAQPEGESFFDPNAFAAAYNDPTAPEPQVEYSDADLTFPPEYAAAQSEDAFAPAEEQAVEEFAPVEEPAVEEFAPVEEPIEEFAPVEEPSAEEFAPIEEAAAEELPAAPAEGSAAEDAPAEGSAPIEEVPAEEFAPMEEIPAEGSAPIEEIPAAFEAAAESVPEMPAAEPEFSVDPFADADRTDVPAEDPFA